MGGGACTGGHARPLAPALRGVHCAAGGDGVDVGGRD